MPTTRPRYTITDAGAVRELLDDAQRHWPQVTDRKELLLRLTRAGHESLRAELAAHESARRRARQQEALGRLRTLVDTERVLADAAWR